jgi:peroxiredoxin
MESKTAARMETTRTRRITPRRLVLLGLALAAVGASALAWRGWGRPGGRPRVGERLERMELRDPGGKAVTLDDFRDRRVVVLVFTGIDCPVGNLYVPRLVALDERYRGKGVQFVGVNANAHESPEDVSAHAREYGVPFPVLKDPENRLADRLRVERTCEAVVLDAGRFVRYHGAIDDQYARGAIKDEPSRAFLAEALDALLDGREVPVRETTVLACPIERADPVTAKRTLRRLDPELSELRRKAFQPVEVGAVTYAADVAPILRQKCEPCHRPGEVAPFALQDYDDARRWAASIYEVVDEGLMPPWYADPRFGRFANDRSLTDRERSVLMAWFEQDAPEGDPSSLPPPASFAQGWTIGEPDLVFEMPEEFDVPREGVLDIQKFRVATGLKEDVWVQAAQALPGDKAVVHHICVFVIDPRAKVPRGADREQRRDMMPELVCYAPGDMPAVYPEGVAKRLPAGSILEIQVHYTPIGTPRFDRSAVGVKLAEGPIRKLAVTRGVSNRTFVLPPGAPDVVVRGDYTIREDAQLLSLTPHMHYRGRTFEYVAAYPDGRRETLLRVPFYDFNWQSVYRLAEPKSLPAGTRIECEAHFDNSTGNPANPDPKATVRWGEQSSDEMMIGYLDYCIDLPRPQMAEGRAGLRK